MKEILQENFAHSAWADAELIRALATHPSAKGDVETLARLHHTLVVQHLFFQAWKAQPQKPTHPSDFPSLASLRNYAQLTYGLIEAELESFPMEQLSDTLLLPWFHGEGIRPTLFQAMQHVWLHHAYHRGQTSTRLRALGGDPPQLDFVLWIWQGKPKAVWD